MQKNLPLHLKGKLLGGHLSHELRKKHNKRAVRIVKGDKVKVMSGQFKGKSGKVEDVNMKNSKVIISGIDFQKQDGTKIRMPVNASNVMITELNLSDKKRQEILKRK